MKSNRSSTVPTIASICQKNFQQVDQSTSEAMKYSNRDCTDVPNDEPFGATRGTTRKFFLLGYVALRKNTVRNIVSVGLFSILLIAGIMRIYGSFRFSLLTNSNTSNAVSSVKAISASSGTELMEHLKQNNLWDIAPGALINPVLLTSFPANIDQMETNEKKKAFLHSMLPIAMIALAEVERERNALERILRTIDEDYSQVDFSQSGSWLNKLSRTEEEIINFLTDKYRTSNAATLLSRINVIPVSLILAQSAIESSWGASRFALEGNNLFGIWTWGEKGIIPMEREEGLNHKVAAYPSILDSVRAYILTLNRLSVYNTFRNIRKKSMNPTELVEGLLFYSERREDYIRDVKNVIYANELQQYDTNVLESFHLEATEQLSFTNLTLSGEAQHDALSL